MIEADTEAPHGDRGLCKGDLIDLSLNKLKCGLPGSFTRSVRKPFPNPGFHQRLVQIEAGWCVNTRCGRCRCSSASTAVLGVSHEEALTR